MVSSCWWAGPSRLSPNYEQAPPRLTRHPKKPCQGCCGAAVSCPALTEAPVALSPAQARSAWARLVCISAPGRCASVQACDLRCLGAGGGTRTPNLLFTRQQRIVHRVLASAVLAAHVRRVVQPVCSCRAG